MAAIGKALVVGGGIAGMSAAIRLREAGVYTTLLDIDPEWRVYGAGITITGPTLRALGTLGVLDRVMAEGHTADGIKICSMAGEVVQEVATARQPGDAGPGAGGILRPILHRILSDRTLRLGTDVRLGCSVAAMEQDDDAALVTMTDGARERFDVVVGADGVFSRMRELLFPDAPRPRFTGQACWRLIMPRPPRIDRRHFFLGGPVKIGLTPVSRDEMYMFLLQHVPDNAWVDAAEQPARLRSLLEGYGGVLRYVRGGIMDDARIVYRPLEGMLLPAPWHRGRALLIGDAVHATTPQLASGAGMSVEDGIVLVEELLRADSVQAAFAAFMERRFERCRMVVENSLELGRLEVAGASIEAQAALLNRSLDILSQPI